MSAKSNVELMANIVKTMKDKYGIESATVEFNSGDKRYVGDVPIARKFDQIVNIASVFELLTGNNKEDLLQEIHKGLEIQVWRKILDALTAADVKEKRATFTKVGDAKTKGKRTVNVNVDVSKL